MRKLNLVVGVDGSDAGRCALREAVRIATSLGWRLTIVAVVPPYEGNMYVFTMGRVRDDLGAPFREILDAAVEEARRMGADAEGVLEHGRPWERLVEVASTKNAQLTVLGGGHNLMDRLVAGNTVRRVIGYGYGDMLVVPAEMHFDCTVILTPVDGSVAGFDAADKALDLGRLFGGEVLALYVENNDHACSGVEEGGGNMEKGYACLHEVEARAGALGVAVESLYAKGAPAEAIRRIASERSANLIVMSPHGHRGLRRLLMGGIISKVVKQAPCPVYITRH
jgi:nucleotide-binding universal stress UspA family protein